MAIGSLYPQSFIPNDKCIVASTGFGAGDQNFYFAASKSAYYSYIQSKAIDSQSNFSYIAQDKAIRYPANAEDLINAGADYIAYTNRNFNGQDWFGFITKIEYINPNLSLIHFKIDVVSTFLYDINVGSQYVRRRTPATDNYGEWMNDESFPVSEYIYSDWQYPTIERNGGKLNEFAVAICGYAAPDASFSIIDGVPFSGAIFIRNDPTEMQETLQYFNEDGSRHIYSIYLIPKCASSTGNVLNPDTITRANAFDVPINRLTPGDGWIAYYPQDNNGWIPNNYKMYLYPYTALYVCNNLGKSQLYKYENFRGDPQGGVLVNHLYPVTPTFYPKNYLNSENNWLGYNTDFGFDLGSMPQLGYASSSYNAWSSSNETAMKMELLASVIGGTVATGAAVAMGNPAGIAKAATGAATGVVGTVVSQQIAQEKALHAAPNIHTAASMGNTALIIGALEKGYGPRLAKAQIPQYLAKQYDDFFSMFGYKIELTLNVNLFQYRRPLFDYIETVGCHLDAKCPVEYARELEQLFDAGIRLWYDPEQIGNFSEANLKANSLH